MNTHHLRTAWPTDGCDTSMPKGVEPKDINPHEYKRPGDRNILEQAAMCEHRDFAISLIVSVLKIKEDAALCDRVSANLSGLDRWARISVEGRLMEIGNWLRAECFELLDCVSAPAVNTLGD